MHAIRLVLTGMLFLAGCTGERSPAQTWEVAAQGLYTGALSEDAGLLIVGSLNHGASLWRTGDHERLFNWSHQSGEYAELVAAAFSPDGSRAVTTDPRTLVLWDTNTGRALNYWATPGAVLDVAMFPDNRLTLLGMDDHSALVFDAESGSYEMTLLHEGKVGAVDVMRNGEAALTGSDDNTAVLWSLNQQQPLHTYRHDNPVREVRLSPDGRFAFTAAQGDLVALWDNTSGERLHVFHKGINHGVTHARFSANNDSVAVGYANRKVVLYAVPSGRTLQRWDPGRRHAMRASGAAILGLGFGRDGLYATTGDGRLLRLQ